MYHDTVEYLFIKMWGYKTHDIKTDKTFDTT